MENPGGFIYAFGRLEQAIEDLVGAGEIKDRLDTAGKTLAPILPEDFPDPMRTEFASIYEALTWVPGEEGRGTAETTLEAMTEAEADALAKRLFSLYLDAADARSED